MILPPGIGGLEGSICELPKDQFAHKLWLLTSFEVLSVLRAPCDPNRGQLQFAVNVWRMPAMRREPGICGTGLCVGL